MKKLQSNLSIAMGLAIFLSLAGAAWAVVPTCGGGTACSCGDTVTADRVLDATDPVVSTDPFDFCPGDGLKVNGGVTLDLGGNTIRGDHDGGDTGVTINGDGATVTNGTIRGFGVGLSTAKNLGSISKIKALRNKTDGIKVTGNNNQLLQNRAEENGIGGTGDGISVAGDDNTLESNKANRNTGVGINLLGGATGNPLEKNTAEENSSDGIKVAGGTCLSPGNNTLTGNKASNNRDNGINVTGSGHTLNKNTANENFKSGINVTGDCNTLERNKADKNSGDGGVFVQSSGSTLTKNQAKQNDGPGVFAEEVGSAGPNTDGLGNKGTDNGGVGAAPVGGTVDCEIDGGVCAP